MWYFASIFWLLFILVALSAIGTAFINLCMPWRLRPAAREFLAPSFGLILLLIPVTCIGWFADGFRWWICLPVTVGMAALGHLQQGSRSRFWVPDWPHWWRLAGFAVLASFPMLGQLLRFNAYSPFSDAWMYLYHAQWLQQHGFEHQAVVSGYHPAAGVVLSFQDSGLRITPSLLLGWLQAMFGLDWSYKIYPTLVSLALICGSLAVGGIVRSAFPERRREAWWVALTAAVTLNGFAFGAVTGSLPQTMGLTFSTVALALRGLEAGAHLPRATKEGAMSAGWWIAHLRRTLPLSICLAATVYCYPELLPFLVPALVASYLLPWPRTRADLMSRWTTVGTVALFAALLSSFEAGRAIHALKIQSKAVTGTPIAWSVWAFTSQSLGLKSGFAEGGGWFYQNGWEVLLEGMVPAVCFSLLLYWTNLRRREPDRLSRSGAHRSRSWLALGPTMLMAGTCAVAFIYFRYYVQNPWPTGVGLSAQAKGQSWSQLKLSLWTSPALLALAGSALISLLGGRRVFTGTKFIQGVLVVWCAVGIGWNARLLLVRVNPLLLVSGETADPFGSYRAFCAPLAELPRSQLIYLDAVRGDYASIKQRELLAYFLGDRELLGDWTVDDNIPVVYVPPTERKVPVQAADWMISYHPPNIAAAEAFPSVCRLTVSRVVHEGWNLRSVVGGYEREHDINGKWFYWTKHSLQMVWRKGPAPSGESAIGGTGTQLMRLSFDQRSVFKEQTLTVRVAGTADGDRLFTVPAPLEARHFESAPFAVSGDEVQVSFVGSGGSYRASATDARELSYLVAAVVIEPVNK